MAVVSNASDFRARARDIKPKDARAQGSGNSGVFSGNSELEKI